MHRHLPRISLVLATLATGLTLPVCAAPPPPALQGYTIKPILKLGDTVAGVKVDGFWVGGLNHNGQLIFVAANAAGGDALLQYADDGFTPIVVGGGIAPGGKWPNDVRLLWRPFGVVSMFNMNQGGDVVFRASRQDGAPLGLFQWDYQAQKVTVVAQPGTSAGTTGTFLDFGLVYGAPQINNRGEIAFWANVGSSAVREPGIFFRTQDGELLPVLAPGQKLRSPTGKEFTAAPGPPDPFSSISLNDAGLVAFLADLGSYSDNTFSTFVYTWEKGTINNLSTLDSDNLAHASKVWLNDKDRSALVAARGSLYRVADGKFVTVLPSSLEYLGPVSGPNEAGQHAFVATEGETTGLYLLDLDGKVSPILKSGTATSLGVITDIPDSEGLGVGLNSQGQVAVTVSGFLIPTCLQSLRAGADQRERGPGARSPRPHGSDAASPRSRVR